MLFPFQGLLPFRNCPFNVSHHLHPVITGPYQGTAGLAVPSSPVPAASGSCALPGVGPSQLTSPSPSFCQGHSEAAKMLVLAQRQGKEHLMWDTREWDASAQTY